MSLRPYYQDETTTIYHGDCRELLPILQADAIVTDPPYGIGFTYDQYNDTRESWYELMHATVPLMRTAAPFVVMPSCRRSDLKWWYDNHPPDWLLCWYKGSTGHLAQVGFADWEAMLTWGKPPRQMHDYFQTRSGFDDEFGHVCPKPMEWARWLVRRAALVGQTVLDPFAGSGTTLRAAKDLGRKAIGIEMSERYCEIIVARCAQGVLEIIEDEPEQIPLIR